MIERVSSRGAGRLVRVSLRDVPLDIRRREARRLTDAAARTSDVQLAVDVTHAALFPSERTFLIPERDVLSVLGYVPDGLPRRYRRVALPERAWDLTDGRVND